MRALLVLCFFSVHAFAGELVYKNSFENTALVSGTVSGLVSTGLGLRLVSGEYTETLLVNENGKFVFYLDVRVGDSWAVSVLTLPDTPQQQHCGLVNATGVMSVSGASALEVNCDPRAWNWDEMSWGTGGWN